MGFRFRKSIKLGGGFRLNLSKSGFGQVDGGMDVVEKKIASVRVGPSSSGEQSSPLDSVYMKSVEILEK